MNRVNRLTNLVGYGVVSRLKLRYKVDLKGFMAECSANYLRLHKLFPALAQTDSRCIGLRAGTRDVAEQGDTVVMRVLERTRYTTLLAIASRSVDRPHWWPEPVMQVRLYHDARLAEVVAWDRELRVYPKNGYPNERMLQPDEKYQWNRYLGEWLANCIEHGYAVEQDFPSVVTE